MKSIRVICAYERNGNVAYFDNLSLTQEVAQTMKYDKEGKLVSVKSTGKEEETSKYENGNLKELVTGGNGTYTLSLIHILWSEGQSTGWNRFTA